MRMRDNRLEQKEKNVMHAITVDRLALPPCLLEKDEVCKANRVDDHRLLRPVPREVFDTIELEFLGRNP